MEATTLEPKTKATEKLLIFSDDQQAALIRQEIESRCGILNKLTESGLTLDEIKIVTRSLPEIETFIHNRAIANNPKLKELIDAGIKPSYTLPPELEKLSYVLKAWFNYRVPNDRMGKYQCLTFTDTWKINEVAVENYLIGSKLKFYLEKEEDIQEYNELLLICEYFSRHKFTNSQVRSSSFLWDRLQPVGTSKFVPRHTYFSEKYSNPF